MLGWEPRQSILYLPLIIRIYYEMGTLKETTVLFFSDDYDLGSN